MIPEMTKLEAILREADGLSPTERQQLAHLLLAQDSGNGADHELAVGQRGLVAWTESTQHEDWSTYYPPGLTNGSRA
jgi:hypothetical protein